ncbi:MULTISPECIES: magnesium chelatase subunit D [unclassified Novosphingobium]|uniref:magnesium chelatase subunit D n=1 Tax=unclassified Novosphingobium TaxID=2644732 RepID=UPI0014942F83|nr:MULTISPECIES: magnesium chelatase subunit D [unclassified Novosphingobium]MBB3358180.1 magnesium chelatase subunit D [Novosphingobium sp. BK256]MBB3374541.1 magnesium chelatase subunit D [Novosphingobium sp. BK280]MBB3378953.1 magnesium chelatase subunit D [Novosphingobium sp. BK258]MBB3420647.1 magnesium chelatase subunit D [Novosphingobium sp. BK267]MBB3448231.1 magnesium chelatase subunit D [Novosphingobium sp. BK352]
MNSGLADALLAARLLAQSPTALGGMCLRGGGPARDLVTQALAALLPPGTAWHRLPGHIDEERLCGGTDIAASLASGTLVHQRGLLAAARGGVLVVPMAQGLRADIAGRVAQAMDDAGGPILVLLDDGTADEPRPPAALMERIAFDITLDGLRLADLAMPLPHALAATPVPPADNAMLGALAAAAQALGIASMRPLLQAAAVAQGHAALAARATVNAEDVALAARLVLSPRATQVPPESAPPDDAPPEQEQTNRDGENEGEREGPEIPEDLVIEAARAAIPRDVLDRIAAGQAGRAKTGGGGGSGQRLRSGRRGRPLGARPGLPGGGARLALIDSLRAAIPWQPLRQRDPAPDGAGPIRFRRDDLRVRRFEERRTTVTVFCVDASGSTAMARLAEAKGAAELILAQAYVKRAEVAVLAFRGEGAEVLLPPTRSLTRAKRALAALPGGGGSPLAHGLVLARQLAEAVAARGGTPILVFMTDGSANIALDGARGRARAQDDAQRAARAIAVAGHDAVVIDIAARPRPEAAALAQAMRARYLPLPCADARALHAAVAQATAPEPALRRARA